MRILFLTSAHNSLSQRGADARMLLRCRSRLSQGPKSFSIRNNNLGRQYTIIESRAAGRGKRMTGAVAWNNAALPPNVNSTRVLERRCISRVDPVVADAHMS